MPTKFQKRVYALCKKVPKGRVTTYKEIGRALGSSGQVYRAVGRALNENKSPMIIPCHRIVCSNGQVGGYNRGIEKKIMLLRNEGICIKGSRIADFKRVLFRFSCGV